MDRLLDGQTGIEEALAAVGAQLESQGHSAAIVVAGGAALNLLGLVDRQTRDVDVLAGASGTKHKVGPPDPLPDPLLRAIREVAHDFGLPETWMNTAVAGQWRFGLPPGLEQRVHWRRYGELEVGVVDRYDLIHFKLYAAADQTGPASVHFKDLIALRPGKAELQAASAWVKGQDPGPDFARIVDQVVSRVGDLAN